MTEYISEKEYEARFLKWAKKRTPAITLYLSHLQGRIESNARYLAKRLIGGAPCARQLKELVAEAKEGALRSEYRDLVQIGTASNGIVTVGANP